MLEVEACNKEAIKGYEPIESSCDGLDNDCDGKTDDPGICADDLACTDDVCNPLLGCLHLAEDPSACSDGNDCTNDACDPGFGCRNVPRIGPCDDGQACTQGERCVDKACSNGTPVPCADDNPCALDLCDPTTVLDRDVSSPTNSLNPSMFAAVARFGSPTNQLAPQVGGSYALLATGPAVGTKHSPFK